MRPARSPAAVVGFLLLSAWALPASAQAPEAPSPGAQAPEAQPPEAQPPEAQPPEAQPPRAARLFAEAMEAMKRGDYQTACPAMAQSYELEPLAGALFSLAECEARAGRVASASRDFARYLELSASLPAEQRALQAERIQEAERRRSQLEPRVPLLTIELPGELPAGAVVELDGTALTPERLGVALALDPGPHRVLVRVGSRESDTLITLEQRERRRVRLAIPRERQLSPAASSPAPPAPRSEPPADTDAPAPSGGASALSIAGWTSVGVGVLGFGIGATAGLLLLGKKDAIKANCEGTVCNDAGFEDADDVPTLNALGTVGFVVGGVGAATGIVMLLSASHSSEPSSGWRLVPTHRRADLGATVEARF